MKNLVYLLTAIAIISFSACSDDDDEPQGAGETLSKSIDASSKTTWNYFSFADSTVVGTGEESDSDNASWFARDDWDIAICRYYIRTNSGAATSISSKGGVFTCPEALTYSSLDAVPDTASFVVDQVISVTGHSGTTEKIQSEAQVIQFKTDENGDKVMPPVYLQSPVYIFKTADGESTYKVLFTQYEDADGNTGAVMFDYAILY